MPASFAQGAASAMSATTPINGSSGKLVLSGSGAPGDAHGHRDRLLSTPGYVTLPSGADLVSRAEEAGRVFDSPATGCGGARATELGIVVQTLRSREGEPYAVALRASFLRRADLTAAANAG